MVPPEYGIELLKRLGGFSGDLLDAMKMLKNLRAFTLYGNFPEPESEFESESESESASASASACESFETAPERLLDVLLQHSGDLKELIVP